MSKKLCRNRDELEVKVMGKRKKYICIKCESKSTKEKWCCKPAEIKR